MVVAQILIKLIGFGLGKVNKGITFSVVKVKDMWL
jgi:hypothetical protein